MKNNNKNTDWTANLVEYNVQAYHGLAKVNTKLLPAGIGLIWII